MLALLAPILGWGSAVPEKEKVLEDLKRTLKIIDNHLKFRTLLVGNRISLADITLAAPLVLGYTFLFEKTFRDEFTNLNRWFDFITHQDYFTKVNILYI